MTRDLHKRTIYPPDWAVEICGGTAGLLNGALCAWANSIRRAVIELESLFDEEEWAILLRLLRGHPLDPENPRPEDSLAGWCVQEAADCEPEVNEAVRSRLLPNLLKLSFAQAHAVQLLVNTVSGQKPEPGWWHLPRFLNRCKARLK